jgi:surface protein
MKLDRGICLGGHWNNQYVLGIKYVDYDGKDHIIYIMEDGIYNVYKVKADNDYPSGAILSTNGYNIDNDTSYYSMSLSPYFEPGDGKVFDKNLSSYAYQYAGEYKAVMSGKIKAPNSNVLEISSIRRDTVNLNSFCGGLAFINGEYVDRGFTNLKTFEFEAEDFPAAPKTASYMFRGCTSLEKVLIGCERHSLTNVYCMFCYCSALTDVNLKQFKTGNITNMGMMFLECSSLGELDISNWDTSKVQIISGMFWDCTSLYFVDLFKNTSNVTDMSTVFKGCSSLVSLDLSNWDTSKVTDMVEMFSGCSSLEYLNLSGWTTKSITYAGGYYINNMLAGCSSLEELRLDECDRNTISMIINSDNFPINKIYGKERIIWCKKSVVGDNLTPPANWRFGYIDY